MMENGSNEGVEVMSSDQSHDYFVELCALSTSGTLSAEEWGRLNEHLACCPSCREIKAQYESLIATTIPALAPGFLHEDDEGYRPASWSLDEAEAALMARLKRERASPDENTTPAPHHSRWGHRGWLSLAAVLMLGTFASVGYRLGVREGRSSVEVAAVPVLPAANAQPSLDHSSVPIPPLPEKNGKEVARTAALDRQLQANLLEIAKLKEEENSLEGELAARNADLGRSASERAELDRQLSSVQGEAQNLQEQLSVIAGQKSLDTTQSATLQAKADELSASLREKDRQIAQNEELLERDHDVRNLIGARDLYIAEIYDVAKTGATQKPFGRVFYTKGKSLIFYAYDLDQQPGVKQASIFQAWGTRGIDQQHNINLGIFYQDDQNKKRWILKSDDASLLNQIDAVFVTVEPHGESSTPSGKPLLFTYLRMPSNHP
jgi:hypothetical protein